MAFAYIYDCPKCGEVIHIETVEHIDTEYDEVYEVRVCSTFYSEVRQKEVDGKPCLRPLTDEEMFWELGGIDE